MRQKELRIALVCYGGVSLAVYMHGVTKEIWKLARASRDFHGGEAVGAGVEAVYRELLERVEAESDIRLRVLPDIMTGASAGGINAVFLAQAVHSGCSLEPLTDLWLEGADVDRLVDPDAEPLWRYAKIWAQPFVQWVLSRPGNAVSESVAPETRAEVRHKVSRLIRGRWFEPPFSGPGFTRLLYDAIRAMSAVPAGDPLLPKGHPVDLQVTATDFRGHREYLRLHSPAVVEETEHRLPIAFEARTPAGPGAELADAYELTLAARATASFPGAFPPLTLGEIDALAREEGRAWDGRTRFLREVLGLTMQEDALRRLALIDGSVLVNKPFDGAIEALRGRPAQRQVDRRVVYIDPRPDRSGSIGGDGDAPVGFFGAIFGSLSTIPREQPIRDNLEALEQQSREAARRRRMVDAVRPEVEAVVEKLFGRTMMLNRPTPARLHKWRARAQQVAAERAGYAFHSYAQAKFTGIVENLAQLVFDQAEGLDLPDASAIAAHLRAMLEERGLRSLSAANGIGASEEAVAFFRAHDIGFRVRRLRLIARRLSRDWQADPDISFDDLEAAREAVYRALALYFDREDEASLGDDFAGLAARVFEDAGAVMDALAARRLLPQVDDEAEAILAEALAAMPVKLRRLVLLAYLGFPFYDVATLSVTRNEELTEFEPVKVDRISPDDARSIRSGGTRATLRGTEFYNFGAFFSRAYRENDYLWGRLHGAERMIDLVCSSVEDGKGVSGCKALKQQAFLAILDEEEPRLTADRRLLATIRAEVLAMELD